MADLILDGKQVRECALLSPFEECKMRIADQKFVLSAWFLSEFAREDAKGSDAIVAFFSPRALSLISWCEVVSPADCPISIRLDFHSNANYLICRVPKVILNFSNRKTEKISHDLHCDGRLENNPGSRSALT
jgi:hypothetical protein